MTTDLLVVATLPHVNGLARDACKNSFAMVANTDDQAGRQACADGVKDFFNVQRSTAQAVAGYLSPAISRAANAGTLQVYDIGNHLDGSPHGSPVLTVPWTVGAQNAGGAAGLPAEVAVCLSFQGFLGIDAPIEGGQVELPTPRAAVRMGAPATHLGTTRPRARTRGRVYMGPLSQAALGQEVAGRMTIQANFRTTLSEAAKALMDAAAFTWMQWSRSANRLQTISDAWVDDAFDTQRRRGERFINKTSVTEANPAGHIQRFGV